jgi:hypothetical protein
MSKSLIVPTLVNSVGPFIVPYTVGSDSIPANVRMTASGHGSRRQTWRL